MILVLVLELCLTHHRAKNGRQSSLMLKPQEKGALQPRGSTELLRTHCALGPEAGASGTL
jgi:hypothetical protein